MSLAPTTASYTFPISASPAEKYPSSSLDPQLQELGVSSRRLLVAIIRRAILDFALYRDSIEGTLHYKLHTEASGWLFSDAFDYPDGYDGLPFLKICMLLNLDAKGIRDQALLLSREDLHRFSADNGVV